MKVDMSKSKAAREPRAARPTPSHDTTTAGLGGAVRETVESIAVAVILAFLFRAFVAEAFVIPTGSMAPTLMGRHKDVQCPECRYWYQAGASIENEDEEGNRRVPESVVVASTCPLCRFRQHLDPKRDANQHSFSGDRILVSKFVYDFTPPERWDVIVFKYPFNAKQNFIKRLIGLPNETVLIKGGDIFIKAPRLDDFRIARKPDTKLKAMLQLVADTQHIATGLVEIGWPIPWQAWSSDGADVSSLWTSDDHGHTFDTPGSVERDVWLRYHHIVPTARDWEWIADGNPPPMMGGRTGSLITDFYAYNAFTSSMESEAFETPSSATLGLHWVSDLALEGEVAIGSDGGELLLQLVKGGVAYVCRIDVATGQAKLSILDGEGEFVADDGTVCQAPVAQTKIRGSGSYEICYSNVDAELRLWVDGHRVDFDGPTTYVPRDDARPRTSDQDPGDLAPVGIGTRGAALQLQRLRVLRDIYYIATTDGRMPEYSPGYGRPESILQILHDPTAWAETDLFARRAQLKYELKADQFFPMGDNSPQSSDARMWPDHFFERNMLIGRALLIYWPHPWYRPIPYLPNLQRMRLIH